MGEVGKERKVILILSPSLYWSLCQPIEPFNLDKACGLQRPHPFALTNSNNSESGIVVDADDYVVDDIEANDDDDDNVIEKKTVNSFLFITQ